MLPIDDVELLVNSSDVSNEQIIVLLEKIHHEQMLLTATVQVYGLIVVPLVFICIMLWWFFKQFLYKY